MKLFPALGVVTLCIILFALLNSFRGQKTEKTGWTIVYKHNEKGEALHGSKKDLIAAIRAGHDIKIGWGFRSARDSSIRLEHVAVPHFLSIVKEHDVTAIIHEHALLDSYLSDTPKFSTPVQLWRCVLSTKGTFNAVYYPEDGTGPLKDFPQRHIMTWYVYTPTDQTENSYPLFDSRQ